MVLPLVLLPGYILYMKFLSPAAKANASGNAASQRTFTTIKWIVTIGWAIYPLGYVIGYFGGVGKSAGP